MKRDKVKTMMYFLIMGMYKCDISKRRYMLVFTFGFFIVSYFLLFGK